MERFTLRWPRKCCRSLISRNARLAKIFLLKTFVTFLIATPSLVWLLVAALCSRLLEAVHLVQTLETPRLAQMDRVQTPRRWNWLHTVIENNTPDNAVSSLTKLLCHGISFIDDKVLIEDFENLPPLQVRHLAN